MIEGSACVWIVRSVRQLIWFRDCLRVAFLCRCCLYCTPLSFSTLLGPYCDLCGGYYDLCMYSLAALASNDGIAESGFGYNQLLIFEVAHMLNSKNTKSTVVSRSRTIAPGYGVLTLGGAEIEEAKGSAYS